MGRMGLSVARISLFAFCLLAGVYVGPEFMASPYAPLWGGICGLLIAAVVVLVEIGIQRAPGKGLVGALVGLVIAFFVTHIATSLSIPPAWRQSNFYPLIYVLTGYLGIMIGARKGKEFNPASWRILSKTTKQIEIPKILDTSAIIDGRIADICETGFLEGPIIIPQFILQELQHIADSTDPLKRNRGRRGLDILNRLQKQQDIEVKIVDQDFPKLRDADAKLIELAKRINGRIITNDYNLNKVAELLGLTVLNINQLSNALKPVVLPGETIRIHVIKEGKEPGQGVAYLDDGTMVVVEEGKRIIGKELEVVVTSILQTTAGRMIFARPKDDETPKEGRSPHHGRADG